MRWLAGFVSGSPRPPAAAATTADRSLSASDARGHCACAGRSRSDRALDDCRTGVERPTLRRMGSTRYRFDVATAEAIRLARLLGDNYRPYFTTARHCRDRRQPRREGPHARSTRDATRRAGQCRTAIGWEGAGDASSARTNAPAAYRRTVAQLRREAHKGNGHGAAKTASPCGELADDLLGRGLMDLAYAVAMGSPDRKPISVAEAASRHDFMGDVEIATVSPSGIGGECPHWAAALRRGRAWHITGSLLGLDVTLAELASPALVQAARAKTEPLQRRGIGGSWRNRWP